MTFKAYPEGPVAGGSFTFGTSNQTAFWEAVKIWFYQTPSFVQDIPNNVQFLIRNDTLVVFSFVLPDQNASAVDALLNPFLLELERLKVPHNLTTGVSATYVQNLVESYGALPYGNLCPNYPVIHPAVCRAQLDSQRESNRYLSLHRLRRHLVCWMLHHQRARFTGPPPPPAQCGPAGVARHHRLLQLQQTLGLGGPLGQHRRQGEARNGILSGNGGGDAGIGRLLERDGSVV